MVRMSPGQREGSMLLPRTHSRIARPELKASAASSICGASSNSTVWRMHSKLQEFLRLNRHSNCVGCTLLHANAMVSKIFS